MKTTFYLLFVFASLNLNGQSFTDLNHFSLDSLRFLINNQDKVQLLFDSSVWEKSKEGYLKASLTKLDSLGFYNDFNFHVFDVIYDTNKKPFFIRQALGEVITLESNQFKRLDFSSKLNSNYGSIKTYYKNLFYSFFGYGIFNYSNTVVQFNLLSKEWNKINPNIKSDIPRARTKPFYHQKDSLMYFLSGENNEGKLSNDFFKFDMKSKRFTKIGQLSSQFKFKTVSTLNRIIRLDDNRSLFFLNQEKIIILIDFNNYNFSISNNFPEITSNNFPIVATRDHIYYLTSEHSGLVSLKKLDKEKLINSFSNFKSLIDSKPLSKRHLAAVIFVFFLTIAALLYRRYSEFKKLKGKTCLKQGNYLTFKSKILVLSFEESQILDHLILTKSQPLNTFFDLECFGDYTQSYKKVYVTKVIDDFIDKLDLAKANKHFKISITKEKNLKDKRIVDMKLKGKIKLYQGLLNYLFSSFNLSKNFKNRF